MAGNDETLWLQRSIGATATNRAALAIQATGRALPCKVTAVDGSIVTVSFELTYTTTGPDGNPVQQTLPSQTMPKAESQWLRAPTQVGDFGMTVPADTFLGGISGLGTGTADLDMDYGNLTNLVFVPVAAVGFTAAPDPDKAWVNGPAGVELSDTAQTIALIVDHATATIQMAGSSNTADLGLERITDVQSALNAFASVIMTWAAANFSHGTSTPTTLTAPTVTGSTKSFSA